MENENEIDKNWFLAEDKVGICGATSTPMWLMEQVMDHIRSIDTNELIRNEVRVK